jgi:hypothetical protein
LSSRRQGLGVQPRRFAAIGQMYSHPWFLLNRGSCAWDQGGEQEGQSMPSRRCAGARVIRSRNLEALCRRSQSACS